MRLVEPFVGGMSVALALNPERALLGDAIPHLVNFYQWISKRKLFRVDFPAHTKDSFYEARAEFNSIIMGGDWQTRRAAELFYFLNQTAFNGICRFNGSGAFNVPYSFRKSKRICASFAQIRETICRWDIVCSSFEGLRVRPDDFIYADPPYDEGFNGYSRGGFTWPDHVRLVEWLAGHPGPVLASNHMTDRVIALYRDAGFFVVPVMAPRRISCNGNRTPKAELLLGKNISEESVRTWVARIPTTFGAVNLSA